MNFTVTIDASPRLIGLVESLIGVLSGSLYSVQPTIELTTTTPESVGTPDPVAKNAQPDENSSLNASVQQDQESYSDVSVQQGQKPAAKAPVEESDAKPNQAAAIKPEDLRAVATQRIK